MYALLARRDFRRDALETMHCDPMSIKALMGSSYHISQAVSTKAWSVIVTILMLGKTQARRSFQSLTTMGENRCFEVSTHFSYSIELMAHCDSSKH